MVGRSTFRCLSYPEICEVVEFRIHAYDSVLQHPRCRGRCLEVLANFFVEGHDMGNTRGRYADVVAQIEALQAEADALRAAEIEAVLAEVREKVAAYGLTVEQVFGGKRGRTAARAQRASSVPKYRDPKTGATWSGRGRAPTWIAGAKNRDRFLIEA